MVPEKCPHCGSYDFSYRIEEVHNADHTACRYFKKLFCDLCGHFLVLLTL